MTPARGKAFVRKIETPESLPGGKILLTPTTREDLTAQQVELVAIGAPAFCDDETCERLHLGVRHPDMEQDVGRVHMLEGRIRSGAWALLAPRALTPTDQDDLYVVHQDDVLAILQP